MIKKPNNIFKLEMYNIINKAHFYIIEVACRNMY